MRKKLLFLIILATAMCIAAPAMADYCDKMPQIVIDELKEEGHQDLSVIADYIEVFLPDGTKIGFSITTGGFMDGYRFEGDGFRYYLQTYPVDGLWNIAFRRHDTTTLRPDGSYYPDESGFDLVNRNNGDYIAYHYDGEYISVCGWRKASDYLGHVILDGHQLSYYPDGTKAAEAVFTLDDDLVTWIGDFDKLPSTPETLREVLAITETHIAHLFPGYTLRSHRLYNFGYDAEAIYSKIEGGCLYTKRVVFSAGNDDMNVTDAIPVPLSATLLKRLETEPLNELISTHGNSDLFLVEDAIDLNRVPVPGVIVELDVQTNALILLTEDDTGTRYLHIATKNDTGYDVQSTAQLPAGTGLDLIHSGDGEIYLDWAEEISGEVRYRSAGFTRRSDGKWALQWVMNGATDANDYTVRYCGVCFEYTPGSTDGLCIGYLPSSFLPECDLSALPTSMEQAIAAVDRSGWAKVNNLAHEEQLHLRKEPNIYAPSLGEFYNGAPVRVIKEQNGWCQVEIGTDGRLVGWMMKKHLAFGDQMDAVSCAFPQLTLREEYEDKSMYANMVMEKEVSVNGPLWITGVAGENLYVIVTEYGQTAYAPMEWFWEGNG